MPRERAAAFFGARLAGARLRPVVDLGLAVAAMDGDFAPGTVILQSDPCVILSG
jgi:hypothetical protein